MTQSIVIDVDQEPTLLELTNDRERAAWAQKRLMLALERGPVDQVAQDAFFSAGLLLGLLWKHLPPEEECSSPKNSKRPATPSPSRAPTAKPPSVSGSRRRRT